jgi:hypothetical protein
VTNYLARDPFGLPPMDDLREAWDELLGALPTGWQTGRPGWNERRQAWSLYAWDASEQLTVGRRSRAWTALHPAQARAVREMARCATEIDGGREPR